MTCTRFSERVDELIDGVLAPADAAALRAHLGDCAACATELAAAERFRRLLQEDGAQALAAAADHDAVARSRVAMPAELGSGRLLRIPARLAVAAGVVAAVALGAAASWSVLREPEARPGILDLARGERRLLGEHRSVVADSAVRIEIVASDLSLVRLHEGAAVFQVEHGTPFEVETEAGTAKVLGTLFHVERRRDRSVSVGVTSGKVEFKPRAAGTPSQVLVAGSWLDVAPDGEQRIVSRAEVAALAKRVRDRVEESDTLRQELARAEDDLRTARQELAERPAEAAPSADAETAMWRELGAATRKLLDLRADAARRSEHFEPFFVHTAKLKVLTNGLPAWEHPWHPAVLARTAEGFVDALAPMVSDAEREVAAAAIREAALQCEQRLRDEEVPAAALDARLRMFREIISVARDRLGVAQSAEIARALHFVREGARFFPVTDDAEGRETSLDRWTTALSLTPEQRADAQALHDRWSASARAAQQVILRDWGTEAGTAFLFPQQMRASLPDDDAQAVAFELRRIDAKLLLLAPRLQLERELFRFVPAEARKEARKSFFEATIPILR